MIRGTLNQDQPGMRSAPPVPSFEVMRTRWVIDYESGEKRLVGSDGQIKDRQKLSAAEIRRYREEKDMETTEKIRTHDHKIADGSQFERMELSGQKFGRLTIRGYSGNRDSGSNKLIAVDCDCGNSGEFIKYEIVSGRRTSCGRDCGLRQASSNGRKRNSVPDGRHGDTQVCPDPTRRRRSRAAPTQTAIQPKAETALAPTDLRSVASGIESILTLAALVPIEHVEALIVEIDRQQQQTAPVLFGSDDRLEKLADGRKAASVFLEFRRRL
ncbi:MAG: hypothetical protein L0229_20455 [Blastocatellia bacterium]|nr:hypothetical protein [Blastocatellia bacterium]